MAEILCGVCNAEPKKYKCPTCALPYCSLSCFKEHKELHASDAPTPRPSSSTPSLPPQPPAPAPVPRYLKKKTDYSVLATNSKFQELLKTHPELLTSLQRVYAKTIEPDPEDEARRRNRERNQWRGGRGRGRGRGGRGGFRDDRESRWTQKKGDKDAMSVLKKMRDGDANEKEKEVMEAFGGLLEEIFGEKSSEENAG